MEAQSQQSLWKLLANVLILDCSLICMNFCVYVGLNPNPCEINRNLSVAIHRL